MVLKVGATVLITGANTGVGFATAAALAQTGYRTVLLCRDESRGWDAVEAISQTKPRFAPVLIRLDLSDLDQVRLAATEIGDRVGTFDVLVNNAAVGGARGCTKQGFELAFGVNHLGHYLLTRLLLPRLRARGRIVHLGSGSHRAVRALSFSALTQPTRSLTAIREYQVSKLCQTLFHYELARRLSSEHTSLMADPGNVASNAYRHVPVLIRVFLTRGMQTPSEGAQTVLHCVRTPGLEDTQESFFVDSEPVAPSALARDVNLAAKLWDRSAHWVGLAAPSTRSPEAVHS